jgi:hypothetical protein
MRAAYCTQRARSLRAAPLERRVGKGMGSPESPAPPTTRNRAPEDSSPRAATPRRSRGGARSDKAHLPPHGWPRSGWIRTTDEKNGLTRIAHTVRKTAPLIPRSARPCTERGTPSDQWKRPTSRPATTHCAAEIPCRRSRRPQRSVLLRMPIHTASRIRRLAGWRWPF